MQDIEDQNTTIQFSIILYIDNIQFNAIMYNIRLC